MSKMSSIVAALLGLSVASQASGQGAEPLVWTEFADPDPHYVPPPEPRAPARSQRTRAPARATDPQQQAYEAGRSVGEAAMALEAAACRAIKEANLPPAEAPAWAASCPR